MRQEDHLQYNIVRRFSYESPQHYGRLSEVNNNPSNRNHAMKRRAMGMISGVSDLILIGKGGIICGIELKSDSGTQSKQQKEWQGIVERLGGKYICSRNENEVWKFITDNI